MDMGNTSVFLLDLRPSLSVSAIEDMGIGSGGQLAVVEC